MALALFNRNRKYVNIEIKDHVIRYAELRQGDSPYVTRCGEYYLPQGIIKAGKIEDYETLKTIMEQCISEWKIAKKQVFFLIPDHSIVLRKVLIDREVQDDEIEGHLYLQLGTSIHLPFEEPVFDTLTLGEKDGKKEILLFAASDDIVRQYNQLFEECKLKPVVADLSALAIYRLYHALDQSNPNEHAMILQFDLFNVNVSVFTDHKPNFIRHITLPAEQDLWEHSMNGRVTQEWVFQKGEEYYFQILEDTYKEIERVLSFYKYNLYDGVQEVTKIVVAGDHPFLNKIKEDIELRFNMSVIMMNKEDIGSDPNEDIPYSLTLPIGLGLRGGN